MFCSTREIIGIIFSDRQRISNQKKSHLSTMHLPEQMLHDHAIGKFHARRLASAHAITFANLNDAFSSGFRNSQI